MIKTDCEATRREARDIITRGGVIAFRTDTFYGIGADPFNAEAVRAVTRLKEREGQKPILVVISDELLVERFLSEITESFSVLVSAFWPGPLTIVGRARTNLPTELTAGSGSIGLRLPSDQNALDIVRICGGALTATSANLAGEHPAVSAKEVESAFGDSIDLIIDSGEAVGSAPSTVVDASGQQVRLIREGVISQTELAKTLADHGIEFVE
jgi:L-threonylcarbamoyladenylate synthase